MSTIIHLDVNIIVSYTTKNIITYVVYFKNGKWKKLVHIPHAYYLPMIKIVAVTLNF